MTPSRVLALLLGVVPTLSCADEDTPRIPVPIEEGQSCLSEYVSCDDDQHQLHCVERTWTVSDCGQLCEAKSPAYVSGFCDTEAPIQKCECTLAEPAGCTPGAFRCTDAETIGKCDDTQQWVDHPCADLCPEGQPSLGCAEEPTACRCGL